MPARGSIPTTSFPASSVHANSWKPKNSLVKQYKKLFELEKVSLRFTPEAMRAIVREAVTRKSGARGLRAITEEIMLDIMYELPDMVDVRECVIHEGVVLKHEPPQLVPAKKSA
jgi:ATP-dependent Clp protease ATP-binding subunit ClpX